jgi:NAD(P)H dehydrogenase (quinone)
VSAVEVLVVYANPEPASFGAAVRDTVVRAGRDAGHRVTVLDLYAEDFQPCLTADEHRRYLDVADDHPDPVVRRHMSLVRTAECLVFVYPTWWSGLPAIAKGWLERVLLPGVAFVLDPRTNRVEPALGSVTRLVGITTLGGPRWESVVLGNAGRRTITRSVRAVAGRRCRTRWLAMHRLDDAPAPARAAFLERVAAVVRAL